MSQGCSTVGLATVSQLYQHLHVFCSALNNAITEYYLCLQIQTYGGGSLLRSNTTSSADDEILLQS